MPREFRSDWSCVEGLGPSTSKCNGSFVSEEPARWTALRQEGKPHRRFGSFRRRFWGGGASHSGLDPTRANGIHENVSWIRRKLAREEAHVGIERHFRHAICARWKSAFRMCPCTDFRYESFDQIHKRFSVEVWCGKLGTEVGANARKFTHAARNHDDAGARAQQGQQFVRRIHCAIKVHIDRSSRDVGIKSVEGNARIGYINIKSAFFCGEMLHERVGACFVCHIEGLELCADFGSCFGARVCITRTGDDAYAVLDELTRDFIPDPSIRPRNNSETCLAHGAIRWRMRAVQASPLHFGRFRGSVAAMDESEVVQALEAGDPERVRALVEAGADIHYRDDDGYDALINAVHGRDVARDSRLLDLLSLLVGYGVALSGESSYGESGLRVLSHIGRFDGVQLLLKAGADKLHLVWTPLHEAVALGSLEDVRRALMAGPDLEARDFWSRTPWLLAILVGSIEKATLLREHGADTNARARCGKTPLQLAVAGHHPEMLQWLLQSGAELEAKDEFGHSALEEAVTENDLECADILLKAGISFETGAYGSIVGQTSWRPMVLRLLEAGADPANLTHEAKRHLVGLGDVNHEALNGVSAEDFLAGYKRVFGKDNPERMHVPFWEAMIRAGAIAYIGRAHFAETNRPTHDPVWCASRFGQSLTFLPDGRAIQIGGEHEDFYDADFCIYNDVFVHGPDGSLAVYGYPEDVFPPTDFHTATLIGEFIYIIGSAGYQEKRCPGKTLAYRLHVPSLRMEPLHTQGQAPGSIYKHRAKAINAKEIRVEAGTIMLFEGESEAHKDNQESFVLDVESLVWRKEPAQRSDGA